MKEVFDPLSLQSFGYFLFLFAVVAIYLVLPKKMQSPFLLAASWAFYLLAVPTMFPVLLVLCLFTYFCGRGIAGKYKKAFMWIGVIGSAAVLCFFKYFDFLRGFFTWGAKLPTLIWPLGLSFYLFAAISYLIDVYRGKYPAERNFIHYALFVSLFLTVSQGPICRADSMLPQFGEEHRFDTARTVQGLRLFAFGLFKAVAVSDVLGIVVNKVYADYTAFGGWMLTAAAIGYAMQLYFNFSGYSEMARAGGMLLGLNIPENFKTPFYSTSYSELWGRWHISLSGWMRDYIYISLGGNRKGAARKQLNIFITFLVSGLWHGNTLPYVFWGLLQAVYRMAEELLHRLFGMPAPQQSKLTALGKRIGVFYLWYISLIFFRIGTGPNPTPLHLRDGFCIIGRSFCNLSFSRFGRELLQVVSSGFYANSLMIAFYLAFLSAALAFVFYLERQRFFIYGDAPAEQVLGAQKYKRIIDFLLICFLLVGFIMQNGGFGSGGFGMYAGF